MAETMMQDIRRLLVVAVLGAALAATARAQAPPVVIFDEDDPLGVDYLDASAGAATGADTLRLAGPGADKLPIRVGGAFSGAHSGEIRYRHTTGAWDLFVARYHWGTADLSALDSLVFWLDGPAAVPADELPRVGLEDDEGDRSPLLALGRYLPALDAVPGTWQRVSIPLRPFTTLGRFTPARFKAVRFAHPTTPNPALRTLWLDRVMAVPLDSGQVTLPAAPSRLVVRSGDRSVVLHWDAPAGAARARFNVYRATAPEGPFTLVDMVDPDARHYVDFSVENGRTYYYRVRAYDRNALESPPAAPVEAHPRVLTDAEFLDLVAATAFDYFWYESDSTTGMVKDRSAPGAASSVAATGFGISAWIAGIERGWISREEGRARVLAALRTLWEAPQGPATTGTSGYKGFFYHFLDMKTGTRAGRSELSTIDTALLLAGVLHAGEYFVYCPPNAPPDCTEPDSLDLVVRDLADALYRRVDWAWAQPRPPGLVAGWFPEDGFIGWDWRGYNEAMLLYLLALGSPTHPAQGDAWGFWTSGYVWASWFGYEFLEFPPLFGHQYSHVWVDFRGIRDAYMRRRGIDYFENSRRATLAQRAYAILNPRLFTGYGPNNWGFTASDDPFVGYLAHGAPPSFNENGTIVPTAPGGSIAFTPDESLAALRHMYDTYREDLWGPYGFRDAFHPGRNWFATDYIGIDQGPILLMIENLRREAVWRVFMQNAYVQQGLARAGFLPVDTGAEGPTGAPAAALSVYPNPARGRVHLSLTLPVAGRATVEVFDVLGRRVAVVADAVLATGPHRFDLDAAGLPAGLYFVTLRAVACRLTRPLTLVP